MKNVKMRKQFILYPFIILFVKFLLFPQGYPSQVDGKSMNPTLKDSDWVFTNRWSIRRTPLNRGDIVIFISHRGKYNSGL